MMPKASAEVSQSQLTTKMSAGQVYPVPIDYTYHEPTRKSILHEVVTGFPPLCSDTFEYCRGFSND